MSPSGVAVAGLGYDVVIVGSAVYMNRWQPDALAFLRRFEAELTARPTWLFSSGPTGGTPEAETKLARALRAQGFPPGHAGRLASRKLPRIAI